MKKIFFLLLSMALFSSAYAIDGTSDNGSVSPDNNPNKSPNTYNEPSTNNSVPSDINGLGNGGNTNKSVGSDHGGGNGQSN